jgi:hypothetical protein
MKSRIAVRLSFSSTTTAIDPWGGGGGLGIHGTRYGIAQGCHVAA